MKIILQKTGADVILDNGALTRISGFSVDYLVAGSLAVISLVVVKQYWLPIIIIAAAGFIITFFVHFRISSRNFKDHVFARSLLIFGAMTGTLPTGLALLRVVDPDFKTRDLQIAAPHTKGIGLIFNGVFTWAAHSRQYYLIFPGGAEMHI